MLRPSLRVPKGTGGKRQRGEQDLGQERETVSHREGHVPSIPAPAPLMRQVHPDQLKLGEKPSEEQRWPSKVTALVTWSDLGNQDHWD